MAFLPPRTGSSSISTSPSTSSSSLTKLDDFQFNSADSKAVYELAQQDSELGHKVKDALRIIEEGIDRYGLEQISLSFNGGKDCTVLIHLLAAAAFKHHSNHSSSTTSSRPTLNSIYVRCASPFPQVEAFVQFSIQNYALSLSSIQSNMASALQTYLDSNDRIKAILVGIRRNDPHGAELKEFETTDQGWPDFMRIHPILDWTYQHIWQFLRCETLSLGRSTLMWCDLYDYGYTSLGSTDDTFPNPYLRAIKDDQVFAGWRPAWELTDETQERAGRATKKKEVLKKAGEDIRQWNDQVE